MDGIEGNGGAVGGAVNAGNGGALVENAGNGDVHAHGEKDQEMMVS